MVGSSVYSINMCYAKVNPYRASGTWWWPWQQCL